MGLDVVVLHVVDTVLDMVVVVLEVDVVVLRSSVNCYPKDHEFTKKLRDLELKTLR